jgi:hypothetical protein
MSQYFRAVVLVVFTCALNATAQEKPAPMPVIDCVVAYTHGSLNYTPKSSDTISLDLNAIDKISLNFKSSQPDGFGRILHGIFRIERVRNSEDYNRFRHLDMKLISSISVEQVTIYVSGSAHAIGQPPHDYDITIVTDTAGFVGVIVLKGTARD